MYLNILMFVTYIVVSFVMSYKADIMSKPFFMMVYGAFSTTWTFAFLKVLKPSLFMMILMGVILFLSFIAFVFRLLTVEHDFRKEIKSFIGIFHKMCPEKKDIKIGEVSAYNPYQMKYQNKSIYLTDLISRGGTFVTGAAGSGKTWLLKSIINQAMKNEHFVMFSEFKGDKELVEELLDSGKHFGYKTFWISDEENSGFNYDPLAGLNRTGRVEAIINMRKWSLDGSDAHFRTGAQLLIQKCVTKYDTMWDGKSNYTFGLYQFIKTYNPAQSEWDAYATMSKLLELLITSAIGDLFKFDESRPTLNLYEEGIFEEKIFILNSFSSQNKELATSYISLFYKDVLNAATLSGSKDKCIYAISDEFGTLENPMIAKDTLEKGRSVGLASILSMQDINQVVIQTNESYLDSLLGTINTFICLQGGTKQSVTKLAGVSELPGLDMLLMSLRKPLKRKPPTGIYISKYPGVTRGTSTEVFRFIPYMYKTAKAETAKAEAAKAEAAKAETAKAEAKGKNETVDKKMYSFGNSGDSANDMDNATNPVVKGSSEELVNVGMYGEFEKDMIKDVFEDNEIEDDYVDYNEFI